MSTLLLPCALCPLYLTSVLLSTSSFFPSIHIMIPLILNYLLPTSLYYFSILWLNLRPSPQTQLLPLKNLTVLLFFSILPFPIYSSFLDIWYICIFLWDISFSATWQCLPFQKCILSSYRFWSPSIFPFWILITQLNHQVCSSQTIFFPVATRFFFSPLNFTVSSSNPTPFYILISSIYSSLWDYFQHSANIAPQVRKRLELGSCASLYRAVSVLYLIMGYQLPATNNSRGRDWHARISFLFTSISSWLTSTKQPDLICSYVW